MEIDAVRTARAVIPPFMEHRFGRRFRCGTVVRLSLGGAFAGRGRLANVSLSGARLETGLELPLYATIEIARDDGERSVELRASVVRRDAYGAGIEWCETPSRPICGIFGCRKCCEAA
jgi:hypothetical protein